MQGGLQLAQTQTARPGGPSLLEARWVQWVCLARQRRWHEAAALVAGLVPHAGDRPAGGSLAPPVCIGSG
jgi:hypothetical protein